MNLSLTRYVNLLKQSGQLERIEPNHETTLDRSFWIFLGFLLGLAVAWLWR